MIKQKLSHYKILEEISRGGMGVVYRALDTKLDREVALKVLPEELVADTDRRERFIKEAKAAAALEHPHIAVIYEIDEAEGTTFIAMELIRGEKLSETLEKNPLPLGQSLELAIEVAEGLARAHDKGIVHRDLKPTNVMLTEDGHAKIIDFGLAKLIAPLSGDASEEMETALRRETDPNVVMGTVSYMSPEQARGAKVDHRSDVFSFGILLHEMLTGRAPFRGASGIETLNAILKESAPRLPALGPEVSEVASFELQRIVDKCLAKDPKDRFQWMKDLVVDLRALWRRLQTDSMAPMAGSGAHRPVAAALGKQRWLFFGGVAAAIV
ncbi:MAG: serine/threonine-protein kinase, partial [Vicinamibacteria bacterium]